MLDVLKAMYTSIFLDVSCLKFSDGNVLLCPKLKEILHVGIIQATKNVYNGVNKRNIWQISSFVNNALK